MYALNLYCCDQCNGAQPSLGVYVTDETIHGYYFGLHMSHCTHSGMLTNLFQEF